MDKKSRRQLSGVAKAGIAVLTGFILLAGAELAARHFFRHNTLVYRDSANPGLGFELLPGARGPKNGVPVSISVDGMRDEALAASKPADERRVVVIGGHETFGVGVEENKIFVRLAGGEIDGSVRVRTVNLSMYSYNLAQKVELACERLSRLQPDVVVLQASDHDDGSLPRPAFNAPRQKNWLRAHSSLFRFAAERHFLRTTDGYALPSTNTDTGAEPVPPSVSTKAATVVASAEEEAAKTQLRRFWDCVKASGAAGAVMMVSNAAGDGAVSETAKGLKAGAKELGIPYSDAGPSIRRLPLRERTLWKDSPFLSPSAHRAAAEELRRVLKPLLRRKKPLPRPTRPSA